MEEWTKHQGFWDLCAVRICICVLLARLCARKTSLMQRSSPLGGLSQVEPQVLNFARQNKNTLAVGEPAN